MKHRLFLPVLILLSALPISGCQTTPEPTAVPKPSVSLQADRPLVEAQLTSVIVKPFQKSVLQGGDSRLMMRYPAPLQKPFDDGIRDFLNTPGLFSRSAASALKLVVDLRRLKWLYETGSDIEIRYAFTLADGTPILEKKIESIGYNPHMLFNPSVIGSTNQAFLKNWEQLAVLIRDELPQALESIQAELASIERALQPESGLYSVIAGKATIRKRPQAEAMVVGKLRSLQHQFALALQGVVRVEGVGAGTARVFAHHPGAGIESPDGTVLVYGTLVALHMAFHGGGNPSRNESSP